MCVGDWARGWAALGAFASAGASEQARGLEGGKDARQRPGRPHVHVLPPARACRKGGKQTKIG